MRLGRCRRLSGVIKGAMSLSKFTAIAIALPLFLTGCGPTEIDPVTTLSAQGSFRIAEHIGTEAGHVCLVSGYAKAETLRGVGGDSAKVVADFLASHPITPSEAYLLVVAGTGTGRDGAYAIKPDGQWQAVLDLNAIEPASLATGQVATECGTLTASFLVPVRMKMVVEGGRYTLVTGSITGNAGS